MWINHKRIDQVFAGPLRGDSDAVSAGLFYLNLSTLSPYVAGPDSVRAQHRSTPSPRRTSRLNEHISSHVLAPEQAIQAGPLRSSRMPLTRTRRQSLSSLIASRWIYQQRRLLEREAAGTAGHRQTLVDAGAEPMRLGRSQCIKCEVIILGNCVRIGL